MKAANVNVGALDESLVLAPERYDPRRRILEHHEATIGTVAHEVSSRISPTNDSADLCLVLGTSSANEGVILLDDDPMPLAEVGSTKKELYPGDVIISRLRPYLRQVAFVDDGLFEMYTEADRLLASTEFYVLRSKEENSIAFLVPFLLSSTVQKILASAQEGGHHPRFNRKTLMTLGIPASIVGQCTELSDQVESAIDGIREGRRQLMDLSIRCSNLVDHNDSEA